MALINPAAAAYAEKVTDWSQSVIQDSRHELNIAYAEDDRHRLDLYLPSDVDVSNVPVLIFLHGGRWRAGHKEWNGFMAPALVDLPAILVSPAYGLSPTYRFPVQLHDCLKMLSWVYRNIADYGGNPDHILIGGHSAGGHLAALSTLRRDCYAEHDLPTDLVKGCLSLSGTMNLDFAEVTPGSEEEQIQSILLNKRADASLASPIQYFDQQSPAFFVAYGEHDFPRVMTSSQAMIETIKHWGGNVVSYQFDGCDHFQTHLSLRDYQHPWYDVLRTWLTVTRLA